MTPTCNQQPQPQVLRPDAAARPSPHVEDQSPETGGEEKDQGRVEEGQKSARNPSYDRGAM